MNFPAFDPLIQDSSKLVYVNYIIYSLEQQRLIRKQEHLIKPSPLIVFVFVVTIVPQRLVAWT